MTAKTALFVLIASAVVLPNARIAAEEQPPTLSANPFEWPAWLNEARTAPVRETTAQQQSRRIDLRATLISGGESLVNVGGKIIGIGETVDGYLLQSVTEGDAVFSRDDEIVRVSVTIDSKDENNE